MTIDTSVSFDLVDVYSYLPRLYHPVSRDYPTKTRREIINGGDDDDELMRCACSD
jgi:hypothetical protein